MTDIADKLHMLRAAARCCDMDDAHALARDLLAWADSLELVEIERTAPFSLTAEQRESVAYAVTNHGKASACGVLRGMTGRSLSACLNYVRSLEAK
jgi:hypothetical protein